MAKNNLRKRSNAHDDCDEASRRGPPRRRRRSDSSEGSHDRGQDAEVPIEPRERGDGSGATHQRRDAAGDEPPGRHGHDADGDERYDAAGTTCIVVDPHFWGDFIEDVLGVRLPLHWHFVPGLYPIEEVGDALDVGKEHCISTAARTTDGRPLFKVLRRRRNRPDGEWRRHPGLYESHELGKICERMQGFRIEVVAHQPDRPVLVAVHERVRDSGRSRPADAAEGAR